MTEQELKEYLNRGYELERRIKAQVQLISKNKALLHVGFGIDYEKDRVQTSATKGAIFEKKADRIIEAEKILEDLIYRQDRINKENQKLIDRLEDETQKSILVLRHIAFNNWQDIADCVHYSIRQSVRIYNEALFELNKMLLKDVTKCHTKM